MALWAVAPKRFSFHTNDKIDGSYRVGQEIMLFFKIYSFSFDDKWDLTRVQEHMVQVLAYQSDEEHANALNEQ